VNTVVLYHLQLKTEEFFILAAYFPHFFVPNSLELGEGKEENKRDGSKEMNIDKGRIRDR
jgi:hypothetical protein